MREPDRHEALLVARSIRVWDRDRRRVCEQRARFVEGDAELLPVALFLARIPVEPDRHWSMERSDRAAVNTPLIGSEHSNLRVRVWSRGVTIVPVLNAMIASEPNAQSS